MKRNKALKTTFARKYLLKNAFIWKNVGMTFNILKKELINVLPKKRYLNGCNFKADGKIYNV